MWFIGVEVQQETSAPPPKKNPGSDPEVGEDRGLWEPRRKEGGWGRKEQQVGVTKGRELGMREKRRESLYM